MQSTVNWGHSGDDEEEEDEDEDEEEEDEDDNEDGIGMRWNVSGEIKVGGRQSQDSRAARNSGG